MKYKVQSSALWIREQPSSDSKRIGVIYKNNIIEAISIQGNWIYHSKGWSVIEDDEGIHLLQIDNNISTYATDVGGNIGGSNDTVIIPPSGNLTDTALGAGEKYIKINVDEQQEYIVDYTSFSYYGTDMANRYYIKNVRGIHGMPYQFMSSVDTRPVDSSSSEAGQYNFGRKYTEKILTRLPLLLLTPGRPKFMKEFSDSSKKNILNYIRTKDTSAAIDSLFDSGEVGKLYSFESSYKEYYGFVNPMCQRMSRYLGIHDKTIDGTKLSIYKWENYTNSAFRNFISSKENIAFYIDSDTQVSESFNNSTSESSLSGTVNSLSDTARELQFMLRGFAGFEFDALKDDSAIEDFNTWIEKHTGILPTRLLNNMKQGIQSVVNGGKMIFPEIWSDSSFSRSYRISIKLRTPDADNLSWFMNIGVPMIHLICLVAPHQLGPNGFQSPFLVRGWYKGFFNCDMGIITDMEISKGDKGRWTLNGLPTEVDISFTMKDLYQILTLTSKDDKISDLLSNTAMLDYIANMCGINVYKPDLERAIDLVYMTIKNEVVDTITFNGFIGVENALSNMINSIFKR